MLPSLTTYPFIIDAMLAEQGPCRCSDDTGGSNVEINKFVIIHRSFLQIIEDHVNIHLDFTIPAPIARRRGAFRQDKLGGSSGSRTQDAQ